MPPARKRRAADPVDSDAPQPQHTRRRQRSRSSSEDADMSDASNNGARAPTSLDALVKKMVRYALATEYARLPIRRADISTKVLGEQGTGMFKTVFEQAQKQLREKFGMEMVELPARENFTISQRRAAQKSEKPSNSNKSWILSTTLPLAYRTSSILVPTKAPSTSTESTYTALYSFIIAVIMLNGGSLAEQKLERYLARTNSDQYTPIEKTEKLLQRLCKEGYLVRTRDMDGGEEVYMVGQRGKVEVGSGGVAGLVREVYGYGPGANGNMNGTEEDGSDDEGPTEVQREVKRDFEMRLRRTLGMPALRERAEQTEEPQSRSRANGHREGQEEQGPRRSSRRAAPAEEDSEEEDEDEESD
ncbi:MAGE protein [Penicillium sp. IBT 16267x]|nr:MAGE protein [Penicillium sp. IBT 16267x]